MIHFKSFSKFILILIVIWLNADEITGQLSNGEKQDNSSPSFGDITQPTAAPISSTSPSSTTATTAAVATTTTTATTATTTTEAPQATTQMVDILSSELCRKCQCEVNESQIDCRNISMTTTLLSPEDWQLLQNSNIPFKTIKMENNRIAHLRQFPTYPVENLYLRFNGIHTISRAAFQNLTELTELYLGYNRIDDKILKPDVFLGVYDSEKYEPMKKLRTLDLSHNLLTKLDADVFEHLPDLEKLILCSNHFHTIDNATLIAIAFLTQLKTLDLSYMDLSTLPSSLFHSLQRLENLLLTGNKFTILPDALREAVHLKSLVLDENPLINFEGDNTFMEMNNLKYLRISDLPNIYRIGAGAFSNLQNLTTLIAMNNTNLYEIDEMAFAQTTVYKDIFSYPPLEEIYLSNNNLNLFRREWIHRWDLVRIIDLHSNPWSCNCSNQWLIEELIVHINHSSNHLASNVLCSLPEQWTDLPLLLLSTKDDAKDPKLLCESNESLQISFLAIFIGLLLGVLITFGLIKLFERYNCNVLNRCRRRNGQLLHNSTSISEDIYI